MFDIKYDKDGMPIPAQEPVVPASEPEPQSVATEPQQEEVEPVAEDQAPETAPEQQELVQEIAEETPRERNTRALRELKEKAEKERIRAEKERDEALRRMQELEAHYRQQPKKSESVDEDYDINIGEEDLVEGKHVKKLVNEVKQLKKELQSSQSHYKMQSLQDRLNRDFPDFNRVVTPENIELLRHLKPHQAQLLDASTDLYATAASAYDMIKEYGIYQETQRVQHERNLVQKNIAKPKPSNAVSPQRGNSPLTKVHDFAQGFNDTVAKSLWAEMQSIRKAH